MNKKVNEIRWSNDDKTVSVECEDGSRFQADHVICTVSLGVLQAHHETLFSPKLPLSKRNAIEGFKLGTVNKIYIEFEQAFWPENWAGFVCLWCDNDLEQIRSSTDETFIEGISNFSTVQYHRNLLCGWLSGPLSREMETQSEQTVKQAVTKWIRRFLRNQIVPEPIAIKRLVYRLKYLNVIISLKIKKKHLFIISSNWNSEPNILGSYSYKSVRGDELGSSRSDLAAPLLNTADQPIVQFAGEATELHAFATVHGAVQTGWREANRLIDLYK